MSELTNEQAGILIKSIGDYSNGIEPVIDDLLVKGIFITIKRDFDLQKENYEKKCKTNHENGKKGGRPKKTQLTQSVIEKPKLTQPNPQNLKDKDKDKDKDKEKDKEKDNNLLLDSIDTSPAEVEYFPPKLSVLEFNNIMGI